jgi:hypothetical protein
MTPVRAPRWFEICDLATPDVDARAHWIRPLEPWERDILVLIGEQGAIRVDQLQRFLRRPQEAVDEILTEFIVERLVERQEILYDEPAWVWLTPAAVRASGTGLAAYTPRPSALERVFVINQLRLFYFETVPAGKWISHRLLQKGNKGAPSVPMKGNKGAPSVPIAEFKIGSERHAVELRLTPANPDYFVEVMKVRCRGYVLVACFCAPTTVDEVQEFKERYGWTRLVVCNLPELP